MFSSNTAQVSSGTANYIEDVFSTDIYSGTNTSQTITNGIDLSTKGGLVWAKRRNASTGNYFIDTNRGRGSYLVSDTTSAATNQATSTNDFTSFNSNGFTLGIPASIWINENTGTYASWTFRKQSKFFDIVTWTGDSTIRAISHNLGSVPGCIIVKRLNFANDWAVYHRATSATPWEDVGFLNSASAWYIGSDQGDPFWGNTAPTSTNFTVNTALNNSGDTYVAYLFAHDAGGFGLTGTDNVITCGSTTGSSPVTLGYEPQWVLSKCVGSAGQDWTIVDNIRGSPVPKTGNTPYSATLMPNLINAESTFGQYGSSVIFNSNGFRLNPATTVAVQYIYIAIRRGPMRVPTDATKVFLPSQQPEANGGTGFIVTTTFPPDLLISSTRASNSFNRSWFDRLRWNDSGQLQSTSTAAEASIGNTLFGIVKNGVRPNMFSTSPVQYLFGRAPGFFDMVCYSGTGTYASASIKHNLNVVPEMVIVKCRSSTTDGDTSFAAGWSVAVKGADGVGVWFNAPSGKGLNSTGMSSAIYDGWSAYFSSTTAFDPWGATLGYGAEGPAGNVIGKQYVAYLFASCPGVSKVGSYTSTGTVLQIDCGFTAGARFVMIKRTNAAGDWYVWDTSRGITSGIDPYMLLNSTVAEELTDYLAPYSAGFQVNAGQYVDVNTSGGKYIFLAIA